MWMAKKCYNSQVVQPWITSISDIPFTFVTSNRIRRFKLPNLTSFRAKDGFDFPETEFFDAICRCRMNTSTRAVALHCFQKKKKKTWTLFHANNMVKHVLFAWNFILITFFIKFVLSISRNPHCEQYFEKEFELYPNG